MPRQLFRQEAIDAQREKFLGEAIIARPVPAWVFTLLAAGTAALLIIVALWGQYTRRERVEGYLALDAGAARVLIPDAGRVTELLIKEGEEVKSGDPMARISLDRSMISGGSTNAAVAAEMETRRGILEREEAQLRDLGVQQLEQLKQHERDLQGELSQIDAEMKLQQVRIKSARDQLARYQGLAGEKKFVSEALVKQKADEVTDQEIKLQSLVRQRSQVQQDLESARLEEPTVAIRSRTQVEQVERQASELQENLTQLQSRTETVIRAPISGVVTNIAVNRGQSTAADAPLATVLPRGSGLHVELLVPTRAIGFVKTGQEVLLRYDAFPYERFGQYHGRITDIGRNVWSSGDRVGPLSVHEPVYRVDVALDQQKVSALGQEFSLRPGMLVNADLLLERRTLFEWVFEPVLKLKDRI
ncbi:MAG TPA: HlyD family efflux transporter periplasmic adaptor subunit [Usitatibacter sp.]|nr:HlyD family efflux transporter periplasmic adaptor subunit [Usitatibacter sp.]